MEGLRHLSGLLAGPGATVPLEGELGHHGEVGHLLHGQHRLPRLGKGGEGLEHDEVDAGLDQGLRLFGEGPVRLLEAHVLA